VDPIAKKPRRVTAGPVNRENKMKEITKYVLAPGQRSLAYLLLALPFLILALIGAQYGASALYAVPAVICILQFLRPTFFGWLLVFLPCTGMTVAWSIGLIIDIYMDIGVRSQHSTVICQLLRPDPPKCDPPKCALYVITE